MGNRLYLTLEQALDILPKGNQIHCFVNTPFGLIGADWDKQKVKETLENAETVEIGGEQCKSIGHALVCIPKNAQKQSDLYFFQSDKAKVDYYEKLLKEDKDAITKLKNENRKLRKIACSSTKGLFEANEKAVSVLKELRFAFNESIGNGMLRSYVCCLIDDKIKELGGGEE